MTITNGYVLLEDVRSALRITDEDDTALHEMHINAASRLIDSWCGRHFYAETVASARVFRAANPRIVMCDDISTTTDLVVKTDTTGNGTFDTTWDSGDYQLEPLNGRRSGQAWPYHTLRAVGSYDFPIYGTRSGTEALVQITALWGWPQSSSDDHGELTVPEAVKNACLIQVTSLLKAKDAPLGFAGFGEMGAIRMSAALHPTARVLLEPYRKTRVKVA